MRRSSPEELSADEAAAFHPGQLVWQSEPLAQPSASPVKQPEYLAAYQAEHEEDSGFQRFGVRMYDPALGRFGLSLIACNI